MSMFISMPTSIYIYIYYYIYIYVYINNFI